MRGEQLGSSRRLSPTSPPFPPNLQPLLWFDCCSQGQSQRGRQPYLGHAGQAACQTLAGKWAQECPCSPPCQAPPGLWGRPLSPSHPFPWFLTLVPGCVICPALGLIQLKGTTVPPLPSPRLVQGSTESDEEVGWEEGSPEVTG